MIGRRTLVAGAAAALLAPRLVRAQVRPPLVAYLSSTTADQDTVLTGLLAGLADANYLPGRDFTLESRYSGGVVDRLVPLARELVALRPGVIVVRSAPGVQAAVAATGAIPIVATNIQDPVATEIIGNNFAAPKANVTGMFVPQVDLTGKLVGLMREMLPGVTPIGWINSPDSPLAADYARVMDAAGRALNVPLVALEAIYPDDLDKAFAEFRRLKVSAIVVPALSLAGAERQRVVRLAAEARLPAAYGAAAYVTVGGLLAYGPDIVPQQRTVIAPYLIRILKGAKPGELPVVNVDAFELAVNQKTATELGITVPGSILARATTVIDA